MTAYREIDRAHRRRAAIAEALRVREALSARPHFYNVAPGLGSSQEIIEALTSCVKVLEDLP